MYALVYNIFLKSTTTPTVLLDTLLNLQYYKTCKKV